jgi:hypothetical protein
MAKSLAEFGHMIPVELPQVPEPMTVAPNSIYCDPIERRWPALIVSDRADEVTLLLKTTVVPLDGYDVIVLSRADPKVLSAKPEMKPLMQFTFQQERDDTAWELVLEPSAAFVRQKRR